MFQVPNSDNQQEPQVEPVRFVVILVFSPKSVNNRDGATRGKGQCAAEGEIQTRRNGPSLTASMPPKQKTHETEYQDEASG